MSVLPPLPLSCVIVGKGVSLTNLLQSPVSLPGSTFRGAVLVFRSCSASDDADRLPFGVRVPPGTGSASTVASAIGAAASSEEDPFSELSECTAMETF